MLLKSLFSFLQKIWSQLESILVQQILVSLFTPTMVLKSLHVIVSFTTDSEGCIRDTISEEKTTPSFVLLMGDKHIVGKGAKITPAKNTQNLVYGKHKMSQNRSSEVRGPVQKMGRVKIWSGPKKINFLRFLNFGRGSKLLGLTNFWTGPGFIGYPQNILS